MRLFLLIIGAALFILGIQDGIRLLADNSATSILSIIPGEISLYLGLDAALAVVGAFIARYATQLKPKS